MVKTEDLIGTKFERLTVIGRLPDYISKPTMKLLPRWQCVCDCGNNTKVLGSNLKNRTTKSCGCLQRELGKIIKNSKHLQARVGNKTPEWVAWVNMRRRCSPDSPDFINYAGRGIEVCDRWENSFVNFFSDMGPKLEKGLTLDRINNDGNYEPGNCRWATRQEQSDNKREQRALQNFSDDEIKVEFIRRGLK